MKKWLSAALLCVFLLPLRAQEYPELGAKLEQYFTALVGSSAASQIQECDFLISSCQDSLVRQYVTLKIYDHYLQSKIMGDEAVAVHVADKWLLSGAVAMHSETDLMNARVFAEFNRSSLIGKNAPVITLFSPEGAKVKVPQADGYSILYFYEPSCSSCKVESALLKEFVREGAYPVTVYAICTGSDAAAWESYRAGFEGVVHVWDPEITSDWQRLYGVLQTPRMFLVSPAGKILGRGLDTSALRILLSREMESHSYVYGEAGQMEQFAQLFSPYRDSLSVQHIMDVADYLAMRTSSEGGGNSFKQVFGDFLYFLSSQKKEVYRDAAIPFVEKYINLPDVWDSPEDQAQVVSLGQMLSELAARTPVGSLVPDLQVRGQLRRRPCLFRSGSRDGVFSLRELKGKPGYVVFYTGGCSACRELLDKVDALLKQNRRARFLLVDMDALMTDHYDEARELLDTFDLSGLPFVLELDKKGTIVHKYVDL